MKTSPKDWCSFYLWHKIRQWKNASYLILWGHCCFKCAWRTALSVENTKWLCSITLCWRVAFVRNLYRSASKRVELKDSVTRIQTIFFPVSTIEKIKTICTYTPLMQKLFIRFSFPLCLVKIENFTDSLNIRGITISFTGDTEKSNSIDWRINH